MFEAAIELASQYTRPIYSIARTYGSTRIIPGAATLFFVNATGDALTCRHVAEQLSAAGGIIERYTQFRRELREQAGKKKRRQAEKELERRYGYNVDTTIELRHRFMNCIEGPLDLSFVSHKTLDVALIHFRGFHRLLCSQFPLFAKDGGQLKQGKAVCRLGFPFVEFSNYQYNAETDSMEWTTEGRVDTPQFPIEGMVTRHVVSPDGVMAGFELSTPGLRGQSGGPAFDRNGVVWGMQCATNHLDLDFDVDQEVRRAGHTRRIRESAFLHVGHCIHLDVLKDFMRASDVAFSEAL